MEHFGASRGNVVRTRIYIRELEHWESIAKAHGQFFEGIRPANTLVQAGLVGDGILESVDAGAGDLLAPEILHFCHFFAEEHLIGIDH